jgi:hypothetical protein
MLRVLALSVVAFRGDGTKLPIEKKKFVLGLDSAALQ